MREINKTPKENELWMVIMTARSAKEPTKPHALIATEPGATQTLGATFAEELVRSTASPANTDKEIEMTLDLRSPVVFFDPETVRIPLTPDARALYMVLVGIAPRIKDEWPTMRALGSLVYPGLNPVVSRKNVGRYLRELEDWSLIETDFEPERPRRGRDARMYRLTDRAAYSMHINSDLCDLCAEPSRVAGGEE